MDQDDIQGQAEHIQRLLRAFQDLQRLLRERFPSAEFGDATIAADGRSLTIELRITRTDANAKEERQRSAIVYQSPEQVRGLPLDPRSDVFAVGLLLFELLTLEHPFRGDGASDFVVRERIRTGERKPPTYYNRQIPEELERIVLRALATDPAERYQSAADLCEDLQRFLIQDHGGAHFRLDRATYVRSNLPGEYAQHVLQVDAVRSFQTDAFGAPGSVHAEAFGKYYLLERVAASATADLFLAKTYGLQGFETALAIKRFRLIEDDDAITAFIETAKRNVLLHHPNTAEVHDLGRIGDAYFVASEWIPGVDIEAIIARSRASSGEPVHVGFACAVIAAVCEALDYAHKRRGPDGQPAPVIHGALHPRNVRVTFDGQVKVTDFRGAVAARPALGHCAACGQNLDPESVFCPSCGEHQEDAQ